MSSNDKNFNEIVTYCNTWSGIKWRDGNDDAMKSIKNKKLDATIAQQPALMGEDAVKAILDLKDRKKIKSEVKVPLKLVEQ